MDLDDIVERLTRAEEQVRATAERTEVRHQEAIAVMRSVDDRIAVLEKALAKYTGFWGAIILIGSAIATAVTLFGNFFAAKFGVRD